MAFADVIGTIETHAIAAGAALTNPITDIVIGPPIPTSARCVRVSWDGMLPPATMGEARMTLNSIMVAERIMVTGFWSLSTNSTDQYEVQMNEMQAFAVQAFTRIVGDFQLGGSSTSLLVDDPTVDYISAGSATFGVVAIGITVDFSEYSFVA